MYWQVKEVGREKGPGGGGAPQGKTQHHNHTGLLEVKDTYAYNWEKKQWPSVYDHKETLKLEDATASCKVYDK